MRAGMRMSVALALVALSGCAVQLPTSSAVNASPTASVPPNIASDCSVDVTDALLSWFASEPNGTTLSFAVGGCYKIEGTLEVRGRSGLTFAGNGATFRSTTPPSDQRAMWRFIGDTGFHLSKMKLAGSYATPGVFNANLQHAHGVDVRGSSVTLGGLTITNMAGDCVYFGLGYDNVTRSSGSLNNTTCTGTGRNGVSFTAAQNLTVTKVTTKKIGYTAFDVEPNTGTENWGTSAVSVSGSTLYDYYLYAYSVVENAPNVGDTFTGNTVYSSKGLRVGVVAPGGAVRAQNVTVSNNVATLATWSPAVEVHHVDGLTVTGNTIPMSSGVMATVDDSCGVNVSGNSYPGGSAEVSVTNPSC